MGGTLWLFLLQQIRHPYVSVDGYDTFLFFTPFLAFEEVDYRKNILPFREWNVNNYGNVNVMM